MSRETKNIQCDVKALGTKVNDVGQELGQISCYAAVFNNVDEANDKILPGAFKRTLLNSTARAKSRGKKYILPMLYQHNTADIIGGWHTVTEDSYGLKCEGDINLATAKGREYWELARSGFTDQFSIIYDVMSGGAHYDKSGVRELSELRLFSCDPVTFACNDETELISVKAAADTSSSPTIIGNVKGPLGPRDETWDSSKAEGQIWAAAYDADTDKIDEKLASNYFMVRNGDPQNKGSYSYPFWYAGDSPHICVSAVIAIAGAIQGSRGSSAPEGLKPKVETLYNRINAKFPDDAQLSPPWKSDDSQKGATMNRQRKANSNASQPRQRKTFAEHYADEQCADLLEDWQDVVLCALTAAVYDAFQIGDQPEADVRDALTAFNTAVMQWVDQGVQYGLADYLDAHTDEYSSAESLMQYGSDSRPNYGGSYYMSRGTPGERKSMSESDATTGGFTADHVAALKGAAQKAMKKVADHAATLHDMADTVSGMVGGTKARQSKEGRAFSTANATTLQDHADSLHDMADGLQKSMQRQMKSVTNVADDLATVLQGSEAAYGTDPGKPNDGEQENKSGTPSTTTRSPQAPPPSEGTVTEDELTAALAQIQALHPVA